MTSRPPLPRAERWRGFGVPGIGFYAVGGSAFRIQVSGLTSNNDEHEKGSIVGGLGVHLDSKRVVRKCSSIRNVSNAYMGHGPIAGTVWCRSADLLDRLRHLVPIRSRTGWMALAPYVRRWEVVIRIATNNK